MSDKHWSMKTALEQITQMRFQMRIWSAQRQYCMAVVAPNREGRSGVSAGSGGVLP